MLKYILLISLLLFGTVFLGYYAWHYMYNDANSPSHLEKSDSFSEFTTEPCLINSGNSLSQDYTSVKSYQAELSGNRSTQKYSIAMRCPPEIIVHQVFDHDISITSVANASEHKFRNASISLFNDSSYSGQHLDKSQPVSVWYREYLELTSPNADFNNMSYETIDVAGKQYVKISNFPSLNIHGEAVGINPDWVYKSIAKYISVDFPEIIIEDNDELTEDEVMVILANLDIQIID